MLLLVPQNLLYAHSKNKVAVLTALWLLQFHHTEVRSIEM